MRILASAKPIPMSQLGLSPNNLAQLTKAVERPYGMVLCVGPTGSGKTTTLHSALMQINTPERKIWTAEDPVEITQTGCARCRSTRASTGPLPRRCAPSCAPTPT
jgi:type II secretory ATPase GspE/PulE/Tfp pilus assembly ATPase PilB-like protein